MSPLARLAPVLALLVLAGGVASAGYGLYLDFTDPCVPGSGVTVERLGPNESADAAGETVRYEDFSERERAVFDEALADLRNGSGETGNSDVHPGEVGEFGTVVVHEGTRYGVMVFAADCGDPGVPFLLGGVAAAGLGVAGFTLAALLSWRRA